MSPVAKAHRILGAACAVLIGGCAAVESLAPPVSPQMAAAAHVPANTLEAGRRLYTGRCAACHAIDPVTKYTATRWPGIIDDMAERAKLTPAERQSVLAYVLAARNTQPL